MDESRELANMLEKSFKEMGFDSHQLDPKQWADLTETPEKKRFYGSSLHVSVPWHERNLFMSADQVRAKLAHYKKKLKETRLEIEKDASVGSVDGWDIGSEVLKSFEGHIKYWSGLLKEVLQREKQNEREKLMNRLKELTKPLGDDSCKWIYEKNASISDRLVMAQEFHRDAVKLLERRNREATNDPYLRAMDELKQYANVLKQAIKIYQEILRLDGPGDIEPTNESKRMTLDDRAEEW